MGNKDNQDYFKRGGRSGGPAGTRSQFKSQFATKRAVLTRDQEHRLPGERPLSGRRAQRPASQLTATQEAEAQLASLDETRPSLLEDEMGVEPSEQGTWNLEPREEEAPYGFGIPASEEAALGHGREPFLREAGEMRHAAREEHREEKHREEHRAASLPPFARRAMRTFPFPALARAMGGAAKVIDRPIRRTLDTLQRLGDEATRHS